jgi:biopolymer transport protein ExbD
MSIRFQCPHCGAIHGINEQAIGRRVRCRDCQQLMEVVPFAGPPDAEEPPDESQYFQFVDDERPIVLPAEPLRPVYVPPPAPPPVVHPRAAKTASTGIPRRDPAAGQSAAAAPTPGGQPPSPEPPPPSQSVEGSAVPLRPLSSTRRRVRSEPEMDMTPMVDVTFQLLIFFMLTASFTLQKSLPFPPTQASGASTGGRTLVDFQQDASYIVVRIDAYNTFHISASRWDEEIEAPSPAELLLKLRQAREGDGRHPPPNRLLVAAHGDALHDRVVAALDAGADVGIAEIQLVTVEEDAATLAPRPRP